MNNDKIFDEIRALLAEQKQSLLQTLQHVMIQDIVDEILDV